jgi:hypothetical protein
MDLREIGWSGVVWIDLGPVEGSFECSNDPLDYVKFWESLKELHNWQFLNKVASP